MVCKIVLLIVTLSIKLVLTAPTWPYQESWNYGSDLTYKDYLKKVGAYPRIFRYGTQADPVYQGDFSDWFDPYPSYQPVQAVSQYNGESSWWPDDWNWPGSIRYNDEYEQHAQQQAQQMERDVADILWQW